MGRTYEPVNASAGNWDENLSGVQIFDRVYVVCGARCYDPLNDGSQAKMLEVREHCAALEQRELGSGHWFYRKRSPCSATAEQAKEAAATIRANKDKLKAVFDEFHGRLWSEDETFDDFLGWVEDWCVWLDKSGGYAVQE